jgi:hypothetical protein
MSLFVDSQFQKCVLSSASIVGKAVLGLIAHYPMKTYRGVKVSSTHY